VVAVDQDKRELRAEGRRRRRALSPEARLAASRAASEHLCALDAVRRAGTVALYAALPDELDLAPAVATLADRGVRVLLPRVEGDAVVLVAREGATLAPGYRGVREPTGRPVSATEVEVVVAPGVVYDRAGNRLGQGGGHYDRLLAALPAATVRVGACFACQLVDAVPAGARAEPVDLVVTERGVTRTGARPSSQPA
jgi:5-formyltetrahydrofolate cyclo-ligase